MKMLNENQVIDALCAHLESAGLQIVQRCDTRQQGVDVIAQSATTSRIYIEAKGGTSSKEESSDHGNVYRSGKVRHQVCVGIYQALKMYMEERNRPEDRVGLAFPDSKTFRKYIDPVKPILEALGVVLFLVDDSSTVAVYSKCGFPNGENAQDESSKM